MEQAFKRGVRGWRSATDCTDLLLHYAYMSVFGCTVGSTTK